MQHEFILPSALATIVLMANRIILHQFIANSQQIKLFYSACGFADAPARQHID